MPWDAFFTLPWEAVLTLVVAAGLLLALAFQVAAVDLLALSALAVLVVVSDFAGTEILPEGQPRLATPGEAISGFANQGLITIGLLFAMVTGLEMTGGTTLATSWLLRGSRHLRDAQFRLLGPVAIVSAFLNNTPVVAGMIPVTGDLARRIGVSSSRLLLPLSYATILGGTATLMGTSTNLVVSTMYAKRFDSIAELYPDVAPLGFFTPAVVGIPATIIGVLYMILASERLIPARKPAVSVSDDPRKYTVEVQVESGGPLVGTTIEKAGLRSLPGLYIAEIQREDGVITAAKPNERLRGGDVLILVGALESVVDLRKIRGLSAPDDQARKLQIPAWRRTLVEAVVSPRCYLLGKTIRSGQFRSHYNAAVVAVARGDRRFEGKLGDVRLEAGDVLLLEASPSFLHRCRGSRDFLLVSRVESGNVRRLELGPLSIGIFAVVIASAAAGFVSPMTAAMVGACAMIGFRCCTTREARRSIDWSVLIVIGATIGIGKSMETSGAAESIANGMMTLAGESPIMIMLMIYIATMLCTELITNVAAATLMFPIAIGTSMALRASGHDISPTAMVVVVMIAASASFLTPFGYQTNTMVYTVGGYRPIDYLRFGGPLSLIVLAVTLVMLGWFRVLG